jgi:2-polyprenyl-6-hydroxyphenyl methylase/3-demethylubiquinone-9 3-methyltransferase
MTSNDAYVEKRVAAISRSNLSRVPNKWILELPGAQKGEMVLDIACGMGYDSIAWARAGKTPVGIDINFGLVKAASELAKDLGLKIHFIVADSTRLPFRENAFDVSFSENLFEHVPGWQNIVDEVQRVLKPEGVFFVRTTNRLCPRNPEINHLHFYPWLPEWMKRPILRWVMRNRHGWVNFTSFPAINWFTYRGLAKQFRKTGFHTYEVFDLMRRDNVSARAKKVFFVLSLLRRFRSLRYCVYPMLHSVQILAVKRPGEPRGPHECESC